MTKKLVDQSDHPNVVQITEALLQKFGRETLGNRQDPLEELFFILLSSKTPPDRYQEVFHVLSTVYPAFEDLVEAHWQDVAQVVVRAGLQNRKAKAIVSIAKRLKSEFGRVTLDPISKFPNEEAERFLVSLPEVSKKSARCVLMYALNRPLFPVDSHCFRISRRLGWSSQDTQLTSLLADEIQNGVPENLRRDLHVGMVLLGRHYCTSTNPRCTECPILRFCPTGLKNAEFQIGNAGGLKT